MTQDLIRHRAVHALRGHPGARFGDLGAGAPTDRISSARFADNDTTYNTIFAIYYVAGRTSEH